VNFRFEQNWAKSTDHQTQIRGNIQRTVYVLHASSLRGWQFISIYDVLAIVAPNGLSKRSGTLSEQSKTTLLFFHSTGVSAAPSYAVAVAAFALASASTV
jgi:hypothetical protein